MKRNIAHIRGWLQMMKAPYWEIFYGTSKFASYTFMNEGGTMEESLSQFDAVVDSLAVGDYKIRSRRKISDTGNSLVHEEFTIPSQPQPQTAQNSTHVNPSTMEQLYKERMENALLLQQKEFEAKELRRELDLLHDKMGKLVKQVTDFEDWVRDEIETYHGGKSDNGMASVVKNGVSSMVETGTKHAFDRFAGMKV